MTSPDSLAGRVALVTGAGRGIGRAVSLQLAAAGAKVAVLARSADQVEDTMATIARAGGAALGVPCDVTDRDAVAAALLRIRDTFGVVDILINNAGVLGPVAASTTVDAEQWAAAINVNLSAPAALSFSVLPDMLDQRWGRIVDVSSSVAGSPDAMVRANAYTASKAGLEAHALNLAAETAGTGVTVNVYRPGGVDTAMQAYIRGQDPRRIGAALHDRFMTNHDAGTLLTPEHTAAALVARLRTEFTGQIWDVHDPLSPAA